MFSLAPESTRKLHLTPLTFSETNGALTISTGVSAQNAYPSSEHDGVSRGMHVACTWHLFVLHSLEVWACDFGAREVFFSLVEIGFDLTILYDNTSRSNHICDEHHRGLRFRASQPFFGSCGQLSLHS